MDIFEKQIKESLEHAYAGWEESMAIIPDVEEAQYWKGQFHAYNKMALWYENFKDKQCKN